MAEQKPGPDRSAPAALAATPESALQRRLTLSDMLDLPSFTEVCKGFAELYRLGVKVYEENGPKLVDLRSPSSEYCAYLFEFPNSRAICTRTVARVKDGPLEAKDGARPLGGDSPSGIFSVPCFSGCRYLVMPVRHEGDVLGRAVFGPFVPDELAAPPPSVAGSAGPSFDARRAQEGMQRMRHAPEATVAKIMGHFRAIVETLIFAGQKVFLTSQVHIEATREAFREIEVKNRELTLTNEKLRELDRLKSNFLATVSHELRTPLTSIIGYSEMLVQGMAGHLNADQDEYVKTILDKGESLLALISSILDITQIEAGRVRLALCPCDVNEVVKQAVTSVAPQAQKKRLNLEARYAPGMGRASIDREKVRQCLVNLLANSLKFTSDGGRVRVTVLPDSPPGLLRHDRMAFAIMVEDTGIGIPREQFERIFETFYQVDQSSTRQHGGAGLGLSIVKNFVEAHSGRIHVESEVGRYSRFIVAIPYSPEAPEAESAGRF
jgi:two-component system sensor histidine kinase BarA